MVFGWLIEVLGTSTAFPFGDYDYSDALGATVQGVPILIPMAWSMMAYPVMMATQRMAATPLATAFIGGWLLASWDLFLDPMMVGEGYWTWNDLGWVLPGIPDIPMQNFLGWLLGASPPITSCFKPRCPGLYALHPILIRHPLWGDPVYHRGR